MTAPRDSQWPVTQPSEAGAHNYLSTACHHEIEALAAGGIERAAELHAYCSANSGKAGAKRPAHCKWCDAACACPRHEAGAVPVAWTVGAAETERALRERYADVVTPEVMGQLREKLGLGAVIDGDVVAEYGRRGEWAPAAPMWVGRLQERASRELYPVFPDSPAPAAPRSAGEPVPSLREEAARQRQQPPDLATTVMREGQADLHRHLQELFPSGVYPRPSFERVAETTAQWWRKRLEDEAFRLRKNQEQTRVFGAYGVDEELGRRLGGEA